MRNSWLIDGNKLSDWLSQLMKGHIDNECSGESCPYCITARIYNAIDDGQFDTHLPQAIVSTE